MKNAASCRRELQNQGLGRSEILSKSFQKQTRKTHDLGMHFSRKNSATLDQILTLNANQNSIKKSMKKSTKNDTKLDLKMNQKWTPKRAKNPTISRQDPDTPPRREKGAKMEPTWSQEGAKREPKSNQNR